MWCLLPPADLNESQQLFFVFLFFFWEKAPDPESSSLLPPDTLYLFLRLTSSLKWQMINTRVKACSRFLLLAERNRDAAFFSYSCKQKKRKGGLLCVSMHFNKTEKEWVRRTFLSHSHSPPPHPHCDSLPPHPQFPSCAFFRVYWMLFSTSGNKARLFMP